MKRVLCVVVAGAALTLPAQASAMEFGTPASEHPFRSRQNFALEFRFGPYYPQIDDEPGLTGTPFKNTFGDGGKFFIGAEFDWQTFRIPHLGTIGPGIGLGRVSMSRKSVTASGRESGDETTLSIYPFWLVGVFRADVLWRDLGIPIVPYVKAGLAYALWRASNTGGTSQDANSVSGKGHSWGTNLAVGVAFALDAIDQGASRNMDNAVGINNSYVYFEGYMLGLNGIGQSNALRVGTTSWTMGLAFEF